MTRFSSSSACRHVAIFTRLLSYLHKTLQSCNPVRACLRWVPLAISQSCMRAFVFRVWMIKCSTHARLGHGRCCVCVPFDVIRCVPLDMLQICNGFPISKLISFLDNLLAERRIHKARGSYLPFLTLYTFSSQVDGVHL
jgi:hypothetical protein